MGTGFISDFAFLAPRHDDRRGSRKFAFFALIRVKIIRAAPRRLPAGAVTAGQPAGRQAWFQISGLEFLWRQTRSSRLVAF